MRSSRLLALALVSPALAIVALLFLWPLAYSLIGAFQDRGGNWTLANFATAWSSLSPPTSSSPSVIILSRPR